MPPTALHLPAAHEAPTQVRIRSVHADAVTQREALDIIGRLVDERQGGFVVTPNVDHVVQAARDEQLAGAYRNASLALADGQPILWMARLLGTPLPEKVSGSDLLEPLMAMAASRGWGVFLLGATEEVSRRASERLTEKHPGLFIVGRDTSRWDPEEPSSGEGMVEAIRHSGADVVVVALGCPKQELWMARYADAIRPAVALGLGGSLDFAAGAVQRAPRWMADHGLEWLYRLSREPRRLAYRYLVRDLGVVPLFLSELAGRYLPASTAGGASPLTTKA